MKITIHELFEEQVKKMPDNIAVEFEGKKLTYKELNDKSNSLAMVLREKGVKPDVIVGIMVKRSLEMIIGIVGILKAGGAYLPIGIDYPEDRIRYILNDSKSRLLLTGNENKEKVSSIEMEKIILEDEKLYGGKNENLENISCPENLMYVIYTSGSTGKPKGVMIEHRNVTNLIFGLKRNVYDLYDKKLKICLIAPYTFDASVQQIFSSLILGHSLYIVPDDIRVDGNQLWKFFTDNSIDITDGTPAHINILNETIKNNNTANMALKHLIIGGDALLYESVKYFYEMYKGKKLYITNVYGPTECAVDSTSYLIEEKNLKGLDKIPIGRGLSNIKIYILDKAMKILPKGIKGEIYIGGEGVGRGYLNNIDLTKERFIENPYNSSERLYRTGDFGRWLDDGNIDFLGRMDDQVKIRGFRIELGEIETRLLNFSSNYDAIITDNNDKIKKQNLIKKCIKCLLPENYPNISFNGQCECNICSEYDSYKNDAMKYFKKINDFQTIIEKLRKEKRSNYDCLLLYSGGKDSSYVLYRLVEMGLKVLAFTFDNGYISESAFKNIKSVTSKLGVERIISRNENMKEIFVESLKTDYTVCTGCFRALTSISTKIAEEMGINTIITGLSRGQIFETKLHGFFQEGIFEEKEIDEKLLLFRKMYHSMNDKVSKLLAIKFEDESIFGRIHFIDYYRYEEISIREIKEYLKRKDEYWSKPEDTGFCSTNCMINDLGIFTFMSHHGYHNYAPPYSWDCRLGQKSREEAAEYLKVEFDIDKIKNIYYEIGYYKKNSDNSNTIKEIIVTIREDQESDKSLCAYYVSDMIIPVSVLREFLSKELPEYMIPSYFVHLEKMPLTANGKIDRKALPDPDRNINTGVEYVAPRNEIEKILVGIWQEILGVEKVGLNDNFYDLGGHSLTLIKLGNEIYQKLNKQIPIVLLFKNPTIHLLSKYLSLTEEEPSHEEELKKINDSIQVMEASLKKFKDIDK